MRPVVVTGLGMLTPLACGVEPTWSRLLAGASGAGPITSFDASDLPARIACNIPRGDGSDGTYNPDEWMEPKEQRKVDDFIVFAMAAATGEGARIAIDFLEVISTASRSTRSRSKPRNPAGSAAIALRPCGR